MTGEQFTLEKERILAGIHPVLRTVLIGQANDRGHSAGYEEVLSILRGLVADFSEVNRQMTFYVPDRTKLKKLISDLLEIVVPCNAQHPDLLSLDECPVDHPACCGRCEVVHRARRVLSSPL